MQVRFGTNVRGEIDVDAAAAALGVTPRTVRRWLVASSGRSLAHIPPKRLEQLIELLLPDEGVLAREQQGVEYARRAITALGEPRGLGVLPAWKAQHFDQPHEVAVISIPGISVRQVTISWVSATRRIGFKRRGRVLDKVVVPSRFHATVLAYQVLQDVGPWRFRATRRQARQGYTWAWMAGAPRVRLAETAQRCGVDVTDPAAGAPSGSGGGSRAKTEASGLRGRRGPGTVDGGDEGRPDRVPGRSRRAS